MLLPLRKNGLTSLFKEVRVFKVTGVSCTLRARNVSKESPGPSGPGSENSLETVSKQTPESQNRLFWPSGDCFETVSGTFRTSGPGDSSLRAQRLKKFNLDWKFQSRLKISISIENCNPDLQNSPQKIGVRWGSRLKFSIAIENFNPGGRSWNFSIFGPLGFGDSCKGRPACDGLVDLCVFLCCLQELCL